MKPLTDHGVPGAVVSLRCTPAGPHPPLHAASPGWGTGAASNPPRAASSRRRSATPSRGRHTPLGTSGRCWPPPGARDRPSCQPRAAAAAKCAAEPREADGLSCSDWRRVRAGATGRSWPELGSWAAPACAPSEAAEPLDHVVGLGIGPQDPIEEVPGPGNRRHARTGRPAGTTGGCGGRKGCAGPWTLAVASMAMAPLRSPASANAAAATILPSARTSGSGELCRSSAHRSATFLGLCRARWQSMSTGRCSVESLSVPRACRWRAALWRATRAVGGQAGQLPHGGHRRRFVGHRLYGTERIGEPSPLVGPVSGLGSLHQAFPVMGGGGIRVAPDVRRHLGRQPDPVGQRGQGPRGARGSAGPGRSGGRLRRPGSLRGPGRRLLLLVAGAVEPLPLGLAVARRRRTASSFLLVGGERRALGPVGIAVPHLAGAPPGHVAPLLGLFGQRRLHRALVAVPAVVVPPSGARRPVAPVRVRGPPVPPSAGLVVDPAAGLAARRAAGLAVRTCRSRRSCRSRRPGREAVTRPGGAAPAPVRAAVTRPAGPSGRSPPRAITVLGPAGGPARSSGWPSGACWRGALAWLHPREPRHPTSIPALGPLGSLRTASPFGPPALPGALDGPPVPPLAGRGRADEGRPLPVIRAAFGLPRYRRAGPRRCGPGCHDQLTAGVVTLAPRGARGAPPGRDDLVGRVDAAGIGRV